MCTVPDPEHCVSKVYAGSISVDSIKNNKWKLEAKTKILTKGGGGGRTRETKIKSLSTF
jgi:hypothetical protein